MRTVRHDPGIHFGALRRRLGLPVRTAHYHLGRLVDGGLLRAERAGGFLCYFPRAGRGIRQAADRAAALKSPSARRVLRVLASGPPRHAEELAGRAGLSRTAVRHHVQRLRAARLVRARWNGQRILLSAMARCVP